MSRARTPTSTPAARAGRSSSPRCPSGAELLDLYRDMEDDAYLDEEAGPACDLAAAAAPRRPRRAAARAAARGRLRPRAAARRGAPRGLDGARAGAGARGARARDLARPGRPRRRGRGARSGLRGPLRRGRDDRRRSSTSRTRWRRCARPRPADRRRRAVHRHARPVVGDRAARGRRAGGATCPRTRSCCRGSTLRRVLRDRASRSWSTSACGARSRSATGPAGSASAPARSAPRSAGCGRPGSGAAPLTMSLGDERVMVARRAVAVPAAPPAVAGPAAATG